MALAVNSPAVLTYQGAISIRRESIPLDLRARSRDGEPVSSALRPLLRAICVQSLSQPLNRVEFQKSLEDLLQFLIGEGRTNANCWAVDLFFTNSEGGGERLGRTGSSGGFFTTSLR